MYGASSVVAVMLCVVIPVIRNGRHRAGWTLGAGFAMAGFLVASTMTPLRTGF
jgi:hypothetical protein